MMHCAVLGANGFVGSRLVEVFHLTGVAQVRPVVRSFSSLARLARFDLDCRVANAVDQAALKTAFAGCETVVHCVVGDPKVILATVEPVYRAAADAGVRRIVYLSTASVHGQAPAPGSDETSPLSDRQSIAYNNAKVQAEWAFQRLQQRGGVEVVMLRPGIVFGPRSRWTAGLADDLLAGLACFVDSPGGICNSIYVDNLIHAIHLALSASGVAGQAFLVGDRETVTWGDFYAPIVRALGLDPVAVPILPAPVFRLSVKDRFESVRTSDTFQTVMPFFSSRLKRLAKGALNAWPEHPLPSPWVLPTTQGPIATQELTLLHQCRFKLPHRKAEKMLGYEPPLSFAQGCQRSVDWLEFAGYPVVHHGP
ncbi:NAD-dependent epimerase/dehydratase family protein [Anthocerotibacter panamensis]|uniref:NAD-dependent epimerase/dehydratase family protein n=1 Tax=Anthocerotibacter panamensis TaxID=2857077 RepID=UPI001C404DA9|nr:NAD-dependent epimerase/dehydratase family protein [Anthocerotibacter panamensis]